MTVAESSVNHGGIYLTRTSTDGHGNAEDVVNDNGDNIAPKSISLGRSRNLVEIVWISARQGKEK